MIVWFYFFFFPQFNFIWNTFIDFSAMRLSENQQIIKSSLFIDFREKKMRNI